MSDAILTVLAMLIFACLISLMAVFMGGGQAGSDLHSLLVMQLATIPVTLLMSFYVLSRYAAKGGLQEGLRLLWSDWPQWLVFIFLLLNSLALFGEVALLIALKALERNITWQEHVPLACLFSSSLAFCLFYARRRSDQNQKPSLSGRWPQ